MFFSMTLSAMFFSMTLSAKQSKPRNKQARQEIPAGPEHMRYAYCDYTVISS